MTPAPTDDDAGDGSGRDATTPLDAAQSAHVKDWVSEASLSDAVSEALLEAARRAVATPEVRTAIERAVKGRASGMAGMASLGQSAIESAVSTALAARARDAVATPEVRHDIERAIRRESTGLARLTGFGQSPAEAAVNKAMTDLARDAVATPEVKRDVEQAIRRPSTGLAGAMGFGQSPPEAAVSKALLEIAKDAVSTPEVRREIERAVHHGSSGLARFAGFAQSPVDSAVGKALADEARNAASSPEIQTAIRRALRSQTDGEAFANDPAVALELGKHVPGIAQSETEPTKRVPDHLVPLYGEFTRNFTGPGSFFAAHEVEVDSFASLTREIAALAVKNPDLKFVWRGQQNADWGLHSSLYRRLMEHKGVLVKPETTARETGIAFPYETEMLDAEVALILEAADWRMSDVPALELFARLQHHGGPTRLLDVTRNPLIAAWFAVEPGKEDNQDARLFALATAPPLHERQEQVEDPLFNEVLGGKRYPFWNDYNTPESRTRAAWGTGTLRRLWVPPAYDPRIAAQNAAFLLEGVPMLTRGNMKLFSDSSGGQWSAADVAASMSIYARPAHPRRRVAPHRARIAPLFSFRIGSEAKAEIREMLISSYGYSTSLVYPDIQGMSTLLRDKSEWLSAPSGRR